MLGSDIWVYAKYPKGLYSKTTDVKRTGNAGCEINMSNEEEGRSRHSPITGRQPRPTQEDCSILIKTKKDMDWLLTVFDETQMVPRNANKCWLSGTFEAIAANGAY